MALLTVISLLAGLLAQPTELPPPFPRPGTTKLLENDAVELIFDGSTSPKASFVPTGTVHAGPTPPDGGRAYIFEIK